MPANMQRTDPPASSMAETSSGTSGTLCSSNAFCDWLSAANAVLDNANRRLEPACNSSALPQNAPICA